MSKETTLIVLGIWTLILPFLGFPSSWRAALFFLTGAGIAVLGFMLRTEAISRGSVRTDSHPFVESRPHVAGLEMHERNEEGARQ